MITNINSGTDPHRIQTGQPPFFVNWQENGQQQYKFFSQVAPMYQFKERLTKQSKTK